MEAELAFNGAIAVNPSAIEQLSNDTLKEIVYQLVGIVQRDAKTGAAVKEPAAPNCPPASKRLLRRYRYPPDQADTAVQLVLQQAETIPAAAD